MKNKKVKIENIEYEIITNYREAFDEDEFKNKCTDYFFDYDYIVGDIAYSKLRLKGFYEDNNKKAKDINRISKLDDYINKSCAYGCKYYVAKKTNI